MAAARAEAAPAPRLAPTTVRGAGAAALRGLLELHFTGALLVCSASDSAAVAARRAFGEDSRAASVAEHIFVVAFLQAALLLLLFVAQLLLLPRREFRMSLIGGRLRGRLDAFRASVTACVLLVLSVISHNGGLLMVSLAPAKESYIASVGSMVADIGCALQSAVLCCFIFYPEFLVQLRSTYAKLKEA